MAEREELQKRYAYHEMSNKVEQADRTAVRRGRGEPTGEVESLRGRADIGRMGDRCHASVGVSGGNSNNSNSAAGGKRTVEVNQAVTSRRKKSKRDASASDTITTTTTTTTTASTSTTINNNNNNHYSILDVTNLTSYQPTTEPSRLAYESILTLLSTIVGQEQGPHVLRDAAQEVLALLHSSSSSSSTSSNHDDDLEDAPSSLSSLSSSTSISPVAAFHSMSCSSP